MLVSDLLRPNSGECDTQNINTHFSEIVEIIMTIKPSTRGAGDKLAWLGDVSGVYTAKNGYHVAREEVSMPKQIHKVSIGPQAYGISKPQKG